MRLAARGLRDMGDGVQPVADPASVAAARRQARRVHVHSVLAALLFTALYLFLA